MANQTSSVYKHKHILINKLFTKFYSNNNYWKNKNTFLKTRGILLKYKTYQATIWLKQFLWSFTTTHWRVYSRPPNPPAKFFSYITRLVRVSGQLPIHKLNSCIGPCIYTYYCMYILFSIFFLSFHLVGRISSNSSTLSTQEL